MFSCHTSGSLVPTEHRLNVTAYLSFVADNVHHIADQSVPIYFQQDNAPCHKAQIISNWFLNMTEFTVLQWPPQSPDLDLIQHLLEVEVVEREIWTRIYEGSFQNLFNVCHEELRRFWQKVQSGTSKVYLIKWWV